MNVSSHQPFDPLRTAPAMLFLATSKSNLCNFRCRHCHIWTQKDPLDGLTLAQRSSVVHQFADLNSRGTVVLFGGEVTMDMAETLTLAGACKSRGLACIIITNGSYVRDDIDARALVESGITFLTVSLDSHLPEIHRYTRGVPSAYQDTMRAIRLLVAARDRFNPAVSLCCSCVIFDRNVALLEDYVRFCRELGVDHADFQLLSRTFANASANRDVFFDRHFFHEPAAKADARRLITKAIHAFADSGGFFLKTVADLDWIAQAIDNPDFHTASPICASHERNLIVDSLGRVALCFYTSLIMDNPYLGNVVDQRLDELWTGASAAAARRIMSQCTLGCGALNCHRG